MAYRLPSERVPVTVDDGPTITVEKIGLELVFSTAVGLSSAFLAASDRASLGKVYRYFLREAQPAWDIIDHHGVIPPTLAGMWRLPVPLALDLVSGWFETFIEKTTAVDELIPPSPLRDQLNAKLRAKRKAA